MALSAVNSSERKKPPTSSTAMTIQCGVAAVNQALTTRNADDARALTISTRRKLKARRIGCAAVFIAIAPAAATKVSDPD